MRKFLVFSACLLLGIAVLLWIERGTRPAEVAPREALPDTPEVEAPQRGALTNVDDPSKGLQATVSGPTDAFSYEKTPDGRLLKRSHLVAADLITVGAGQVELRDFRYDIFTPESGAREVGATAELARARLAIDPKSGIAIDQDFPVQLRAAELRYEIGSRFAPLVLNVPELECVLAFESASSTSAVRLEGRGLSATGTGLVLERRAESITLQRDPQAKIVLEDRSIVDLASRAALVVRSRPDLGEDFAEFEVRDAARLVLSGAQALETRAERIVLIGRIERGAASRFRPSHGEAQGDVRLTLADGSASGDRLVIEFDERGKLARAALDGRPTLDIVLRGTRLENVPPELLREGETLTVRLDGAGPLEFFYGEPARFAFTGPGRMTLPAVGLTLECDGDIDGSQNAQGRLESLTARNNVRVSYEQLVLSSAQVDVRSTLDDQGRAIALLDSAGPTSINGTLGDGRPLQVVAAGGLSLERTRSAFVIPRADAVAFEIGGRKPLRARARTLRDLDVLATSFIAQGDVEVETASGRGRGETFSAQSEDSGELSGSSEEPARFDFANGSFRAQFIDASPAWLTARGRAHAHVDYREFDYDIDSDWIAVQRVQRPSGEIDIVLDAGEQVELEQVGAAGTLELSAQLLHAEASEFLDPSGGPSSYAPNFARASGNVAFELSDPKPRLNGRCGTLELRGDRSGLLEPLPGSEGKVELHGHLASRIDSFDVLARRIEFHPESISASDYEADFHGIELELGARSGDAQQRSLRAVGGFVSVDPKQILLAEGVYLGGPRNARDSWSLDAASALLRDRGDDPREDFSVSDLVAEGDVRVSTRALGRAHAQVLIAAHGSGQVSLLGSPDSETDAEALIERDATTWRSSRFDIDLISGFLRSGPGRIVGDPHSLNVWTLSYDAIEPLALEDETVQIFRQPVWSNGEVELRANWALAWIDPSEWRRLSSAPDAGDFRVPDPAARPTSALPKRLFGRFAMGASDTWLHELYLDGDVEYRVGDARKARAEGMYLDLIDGHGWVKEFVLAVNLPIGSRTYALKVHTSWIRASLDGSMAARDAVATTCDFDVPDYVMRIEEFSIKPRYRADADSDERSAADASTGQSPRRKLDGWELELKGNQLALIGDLGLPLPTIGGPLSEDYEFDREALTFGGVRLPSFGSDSKLGAFISASFSSDIGSVGKAFHWAIGKLLASGPELPPLEGRTRTHVDLHSRGIEVGFESDFRSPGLYDWSVSVDGVLDAKRDRGLVRVDEDDRSEGRAWLHTRGRVFLERGEWIDAALTRQSDAGVQAEFFEREFIAYDEHESYLHWRRASEVDYLGATAEARLETYRNEVVDQPALTWYRGRSQVGTLGSLPIVHSLRTSLDALARYEGDPRYARFLGPAFPDALGDRDVLRADAQDRIELPWSTGLAGLRVTPFVAARATGWNKNAADDGDASRAAFDIGVQLATTFWRTFDGGSRHMFTPSVQVRGDIASTDNGGAVLQFDGQDRPTDGRFVDLALRSRWENRELRSDFDIEVTQTYADQVDAALREGWLPISTRVSWLSEFLGLPYGLWHEGRYDTDRGHTDYSRTFGSVEPMNDLALELGYHTARDTVFDPADRLYNALSVGARYAFSPKWELEGRQTFSVGGGDERLASNFTVRRFGHDFVFEIDYSFIAGEGRESFSFHFTPLFSWRRDDSTLLERWREARR